MLDLDRSLNTSGFDGDGSLLDVAWVRELAARSPTRRTFQVVAPYRSSRVCLSVVAMPDGQRDVEAFKRAARRRAAFTHEHSLDVIAAGKLPGLLYLGMAAGEAVQLASRLAGGPLGTRECIAALTGVAEAVDAAERGGLTVWELTPRSVLIDDRGAGLIGDVGTGREAFGRPDPDSDPQAAWLAPEVLDGEVPDARSSVYALGTLLYASLTVAEAHAGTASRSKVRKRVRGRARAAADAPDISAQLDEVIGCALSPDPAERFETAGAFIDAAREADAQPRARRSKASAPAAEPASRPAPRSEPKPEPKAERKSRAERKPKAEPKPERKSRAERKPKAEPKPERRGAKPERRGAKPERRGAKHEPKGAKPEPKSRPARPRLGPAIALTGVALVAGVAAGRLAAPDPAPAPPPAPAAERVSGPGVSFTVPAGWREGAPPPGALAAEDALVRGPRGSGSSALVAAVTPGRVEAGPEWGGPEPVRLGEFEALRYPGESLDAGARGTLYLAPTSAGMLTITCVAGADAPARFLATCERVASTAQLAAGRPLPLAERAQLEARLAAIGRTLATRRAAIRSQLAEAERRRGQAQAATALAGTYARTAERAGPVSGALSDALERTASAYRRLSRAALSGDGPAFGRARADVEASEAAVAKALRESG